jgi:hypothetical protein
MPLPLAVPAIWRRVRVASGRGAASALWRNIRSGTRRDSRRLGTKDVQMTPSVASWARKTYRPAPPRPNQARTIGRTHKRRLVMSVAIDPGATKSRHIDPSPLQAILYFPMYRV